jgi:hypothetical protein
MPVSQSCTSTRRSFLAAFMPHLRRFRLHHSELDLSHSSLVKSYGCHALQMYGVDFLQYRRTKDRIPNAESSVGEECNDFWQIEKDGSFDPNVKFMNRLEWIARDVLS